jgi:hypothetical protein
MTTYLASINPHPRDAHIHFDEGPHKYTIQGINGITAETEFTSVTTFVHNQYEQFDTKAVIAGMMRNTKKWNDPTINIKYYGKTVEEIEKMWAKSGDDAAAKGTAMHAMIECFYNTPPPGESGENHCPEEWDGVVVTGQSQSPPPELTYFKNFHNDFIACDPPTLRPYRTEWTVFHEEARIAGSIDMVYEIIGDTAATPAAAAPAASSLVIYDWKRCRQITKTNPSFKFAIHPTIEHIPDTNFWHYALQLNTYKYILQTKYDKTVTDLYIVVLHPDAQNYQRIKLPNLQSEVAELFEERIKKFTSTTNAK